MHQTHSLILYFSAEKKKFKNKCVPVSMIGLRFPDLGFERPLTSPDITPVDIFVVVVVGLPVCQKQRRLDVSDLDHLKEKIQEAVTSVSLNKFVAI